MLVKCPTCGNNISSNASKCPHCGEPFKKVYSKGMITIGLLILLLAPIGGIGCGIGWGIFGLITISLGFSKTSDLDNTKRKISKNCYWV